MARQYSMTWIASRHRWMKMYRGRRYVISCKALNAPETKEGSYQTANEWWRLKQAEIDGYGRKPPKPKPGSKEAKKAILEAFAGRRFTHPAEISLTLAEFMNYFDENTPLPPGVAEALLGPAEVARIHAGVDALLNAPPAVSDDAISTHAKAWHQHQQAIVAAGQMSAERAANNQNCLAHFLAFVRGNVVQIDAEKLSAFYLFCVGQITARRNDKGDGWSVAYARDVFAVAKTFIRWLWERGTIDLPKNIGSRSFKFGSAAQVIRTWTVDEFKMAVQKAPGKLKLALLLMANCGMTQKDISDLLDTDVDWAQGRIIKKRVKTAVHENVPVVNVKLWPITFKLLQQYRSGTERVLLNEDGLPYIRTKLKATGKLSKADGLRSHWVHVRKRLGLNRSLKQLRKLGSTLLEGHPVYGRFVQYWLGQSPRTVAQ